MYASNIKYKGKRIDYYSYSTIFATLEQYFCSENKVLNKFVRKRVVKLSKKMKHDILYHHDVLNKVIKEAKKKFPKLNWEQWL